MNAARESLLHDLYRGYRIFGALGWGDLGDGHISGRDPIEPDCFWFLRYGVPFTQANIDDFVLIDPNGDLVKGQGRINRAGFRIHRPLLTARSDIVSAAHTHTPWGTPFSGEARIIEPITQESCIFFEDCALFDDDEVQIQDLAAGERIAQCMGKNNALVLRNHGHLTVGSSVPAAVVRFVLFERVAEAHLKVRNPQPISAEAARYAKSDLFRTEQQRSMFDFLAGHYGIE